MPPKSKIKQLLSKAQRTQIKRLIEVDDLSVDDLTAMVHEWGYEISRTSVGRYKQRIDRMGERMRRLREMTDALTPALSDAVKQGEQTRMLVDMIQGLLFDLVDKLYAEDAEVNSKDIALLGKGIAELARTLRLSQDFEENIRKQVAKEEREKAAAEVEKVGKKKGLSEESIKEIQQRVMMG